MTDKIYRATIDNILSYYQGLFHQTDKPLYPTPKTNKSIIDEVGNVKKMLDTMNIKLKYKYSVSNYHCFVGLDEHTHEKKFLLKVYVYPTHNTKLLESIVTEIKIMEMLNPMVLKKVTPHLPIQIIGYSTDAKIFAEIPEECIKQNAPGIDYLHDFREGYYNDQYEKMATILISELDDGVLYNYINKTSMSLETWTVIIFQIIYTIYITKTKLRNFVFGNLHPKKINYQHTFLDNGNYAYYTKNHKFVIPNIGIRIKIVNFDKSFFFEAKDDAKHFIPSMDQDVEYFLTSLENDVLGKISGSLPNEIISFIDRNKKSLPSKILSSDPLFQEYRREKN